MKSKVNKCGYEKKIYYFNEVNPFKCIKIKLSLFFICFSLDIFLLLFLDKVNKLA